LITACNQSPELNDADWITWTTYDFCPDPWESRIRLWRDGEFSTLTSSEDFEPVSPSIDNLGRVAWKYRYAGGANAGVRIWQKGSVVTLDSDHSGGPLLNDRGDVAFFRFYSGGPVGAYEVWLWRDGRFFQITNNPHDMGWENVWSLPVGFNNRGEIMILRGLPWYYELALDYMKLAIGSAGVPSKMDISGARRP
jgi:hypothetical protein